MVSQIGVDLNVHPCYCTGIEMMDDENYLAADGRHVFVCQKNTLVNLTPYFDLCLKYKVCEQLFQPYPCSRSLQSYPLLCEEYMSGGRPHNFGLIQSQQILTLVLKMFCGW